MLIVVQIPSQIKSSSHNIIQIIQMQIQLESLKKLILNVQKRFFN